MPRYLRKRNNSRKRNSSRNRKSIRGGWEPKDADKIRTACSKLRGITDSDDIDLEKACLGVDTSNTKTREKYPNPIYYSYAKWKHGNDNYNSTQIPEEAAYRANLHGTDASSDDYGTGFCMQNYTHRRNPPMPPANAINNYQYMKDSDGNDNKSRPIDDKVKGLHWCCDTMLSGPEDQDLKEKCEGESKGNASEMSDECQAFQSKDSLIDACKGDENKAGTMKAIGQTYGEYTWDPKGADKTLMCANPTWINIVNDGVHEDKEAEFKSFLDFCKNDTSGGIKAMKYMDKAKEVWPGLAKDIDAWSTPKNGGSRSKRRNNRKRSRKYRR